MKPLPLRPLPVTREALSDYLERLASANGYQASELWSILDRGEYSHEQVLSGALNGHVLPEFSGPMQRGVDIKVRLLGLRAADFTRLRRR